MFGRSRQTGANPLCPLEARATRRLGDGSRMSREVHVRFCESGRGRFPPATHLVVVCPTVERAEQARDLAAATLAGLGLRLHPDKTKIVCLRQGQVGFDFLGFHHRMVESWKRPGRYYLQKWPSTRAMASIRAKVRDRTPRGYAGRDLAVVVEELNPVLRGWGAYFRYGNSNRKFSDIDSYVHWRMSKLASVKYATKGRRLASRCDYDWMSELGIYRLTGNVKYWSSTAHALR